MLVYVACLRDIELTTDDVMCVQTSFARLETYVKEYFGISEVNKYNKPAKYSGYTKYQYSEFEDDLDGFFTFDDDGEITKVYVWIKLLDETP